MVLYYTYDVLTRSPPPGGRFKTAQWVFETYGINIDDLEHYEILVMTPEVPVLSESGGVATATLSFLEGLVALGWKTCLLGPIPAGTTRWAGPVPLIGVLYGGGMDYYARAISSAEQAVPLLRAADSLRARKGLEKLIVVAHDHLHYRIAGVAERGPRHGMYVCHGLGDVLHKMAPGRRAAEDADSAGHLWAVSPQQAEEMARAGLQVHGIVSPCTFMGSDGWWADAGGAGPEWRAMARATVGWGPSEGAAPYKAFRARAEGRSPLEGAVFAVVGRVAHDRHASLIPGLMARLRDAMPGATLLVIGDGVLREAVETATKEVGVGFSGWLGSHDLRLALSGVDVVVGLGRETYGLSHLEALTRGCGVVAPAGCGVADVFAAAANFAPPTGGLDEIARQALEVARMPLCDRLEAAASSIRELRSLGRGGLVAVSRAVGPETGPAVGWDRKKRPVRKALMVRTGGPVHETSWRGAHLAPGCETAFVRRLWDIFKPVICLFASRLWRGDLFGHTPRLAGVPRAMVI